MKIVQDEIRRGPWTEQEDQQLICHVNLYGDRRWDFIAKVSGLNRTGKSCRLRWLNYLHPGLKRGKMTPQEEKLVIELHSKWGNRWSRIARKLPGRTDNEIKNYWRSHMRKKTQDKKITMLLAASSFSNSRSSASDNPKLHALPSKVSRGDLFFDVGCPQISASMEIKNKERERKAENAMDDIWQEIALSEGKPITPANEFYTEDGCNFFSPELIWPTWEYSAGSPWKMHNREQKMFLPITDL
ncbi:hypothetical protein SAY86_032204 [Trapa natans]|uniref:Uncharacterized protein n=1 Tax=Trapa natans TaxID=22666 RepID=A0AAN7R920_TRANT|nr:hypothetical protein SAY86_032204 [Trapa natans]